MIVLPIESHYQHAERRRVQRRGRPQSGLLGCMARGKPHTIRGETFRRGTTIQEVFCSIGGSQEQHEEQLQRKITEKRGVSLLRITPTYHLSKCKVGWGGWATAISLRFCIVSPFFYSTPPQIISPYLVGPGTPYMLYKLCLHCPQSLPWLVRGRRGHHTVSKSRTCTRYCWKPRPRSA